MKYLHRSSRLHLALIASALAFSPRMAPASQQGSGQAAPFDCGYQAPEKILADLEEAIARGEISDPALKPLPQVAPRRTAWSQAAEGPPAALPCLTRAQVFAFEDTAQVLLTNFSNGELFDLMTAAANALMVAHGDNYDFIGYFLNFDPDHLIGAAFYAGIENDVTGIGQAPFNSRAALGLAGNNIEGYIMMWNVNAGFWAPGNGPSAEFTRLALGQEFEHRYAMFLPNLLDGRQLQGDNAGCGRGAHWNWAVDGQGSSMEIANWTGSNPAVIAQNFVTFNTDIPGSIWSYSDLYLMGYVTPAEMDAGNSELRYMEAVTDCSSNHNGVISSFDSSDIITAAGPRVPDAATEDKDYRCGWIMFHLPGSLPTNADLDRAIGILEQQQIDWSLSSLGRGSIDNTTFDDCNCNGIPDAADIAGVSPDTNGNGIPDECEDLIVNYCTGKTNSLACVPFLSQTGTPSASSTNPFTITGNDLIPSQSGLMFYGFKKGNLGFHGGKLCIKSPLTRLLPLKAAKNTGPLPCTGRISKNFNSRIQAGADPLLTVGQSVNGQFLQRDGSNTIGGFGDTLTNGVQFVVLP